MAAGASAASRITDTRSAADSPRQIIMESPFVSCVRTPRSMPGGG
jgi:hypothetical protein